jgi:hypothetical protein
MWHNNQTVTHTYTTVNSQNCYAIVNGLSGWKRVKTGNIDGVTNCWVALCAARANGRPVDVYVVSDMIERVTLR